MRVLCSFVGGAGHLVPQIPLHRALAAAGHDLTLAGRASAVDAAPDGIYARVVVRPDKRTQIAEAISPLEPVNVEHELSVIGSYFAGPAALRSAELIGEHLAGVDLLVCDEVDFGAIAAAQGAGVPVVVVAVIVSGALVRPDRLTDALESLRRSLGVPESIRARGDFYVIPFDPSMRDPQFPAPPDALYMRPDSGSVPCSDGSIVATLGTEFNTESGDLFDRILSALAADDTPATVAIGRDLDPARFGPQPAHIRIEQYVDFDAVIPRASVVMHHGGSGLFMRSVLGGATQLVFPMGADQPFTADRVDRLGLGRVLDALSATPTAIGNAIVALRGDPSTASRVDAMRRSTLDLPTPATVAERIGGAIATASSG